MKHLLIAFLVLFLLAPQAHAGRTVTVGADDAITTTGGGASARGTGTTFTIAGWFNISSTAAQGDFDVLYDECDSGLTDCHVNIFVKINGNVTFFYRPGGGANPSCSIIDAGVYDDGKWHWYAFIGSADNAYTGYVDGVQSAATCTTSITLSVAEPKIVHINEPTSQSLIVDAKFGRTMAWQSALPIMLVKAAMYGFVAVKPFLFFPMLGIGTTEVDWSGNGFTGTVVGGMTGGANPPIGRLR